jgi:predicted porin
MKKSLLALAVLGAFAGAASAQSSVTLFGVVDANVKSVKNGDVTTRQVGTDGLASSRLGFRGIEDLGGGLQAGFWIEGALQPDTGNAGGQTWQRRSTVSLIGGFGEVRLGRDYTPSFWNLTVFDPFGTNGVGSYLNLFASGAIGTPLLSGAQTLVRDNNTVGYFLPSNLGGFYGQVQVAAPEGGTGNKYVGGRVGYGVGPLNVAGAWGRTRISGPGVDPQRNFTMIDFGGSYDVGFAQFMAQYSRMTAEFVVGAGTGDAKQTNYLLGVLVPMGQGQIRASYARAKGSELADPAVAKLYALGYVYNLSKRTALYGTYARITNDGGAAFAVGTPPAVTAANLTSSGYEVGIRHSF